MSSSASACFKRRVIVRYSALSEERNCEFRRRRHSPLSTFAEQCERLLMALLLILLGGAVASGVLGALSAQEIVFALVFVLAVRPIAGWIGMLGTGLQQRERWTIAIFGVRGIGSLYYLAFALNHAEFEQKEALWAMVCLVVLLSILLHGVSAQPVMQWLDNRRKRRRSAARPG